MNGTTQQIHAHEGTHEEIESRSYPRILAGGSMVEALGGSAAIVLAIVGLSGVFPADLAAVAVIGIGTSLLFEGGAIGSRFARLLTTNNSSVNSTNLGGGMTAEFMGGAAGVVLGLLALLQVVPQVLIPIAAIVFGGTLLLGSSTAARLNYLEITTHTSHENAQAIAGSAVSAAAGAQVLTAITAVVLGILALAGFNPMILTLVAFLCVGVSVLMSGTTISERILSLLTA